MPCECKITCLSYNLNEISSNKLIFRQLSVILFLPHELNIFKSYGHNAIGIVYLFLRVIFEKMPFNLCGNKSEVLVQVCFRFGNTLYFLGGNFMRKRFVTTIAVFCLCALCAVMMAACGTTDVSGKTYVFSDITVAENEYITADDVKEIYEDMTLTFNEDNTVDIMESLSGTWSQDGSTVTVTANGVSLEFKVSGNKLIASNEESGISMTITFVLQ